MKLRVKLICWHMRGTWDWGLDEGTLRMKMHLRLML